MRNINKSMAIILALLVSSTLLALEVIDRKKILDAGEEWKEMYDRYEIDKTTLDSLKSEMGENLMINVYLGLWCIDSLNNVPAFIKILDALEPDTVNVNYYSVKRSDKKGTSYFVSEFKVERVPTFIFYRSGKEIGRIIENPEKSLIQDFLDIVSNY